jgi:glycosyltransferase involved in cell wall biosynthesis
VPDAPTIDYSIVLPAYNEEALLPRTLASVRQAMEAADGLRGEIVVADNDSEDRTAEIAREFGARVVHDPHRQIARARNAGAAAADGRYLIFLDADTMLPAATLRATLGILESGRFCGGGAAVTFDADLPWSMHLLMRGFNASFRILRWGAGCYLYSLREAFAAVGGFDERFYASEEAHFSRSIRIWGARRGLGFAVVDAPVVTSDRKIAWFGWRAILREFGAIMLEPARIMGREGCRMWYERPGATASGGVAR